MIKPTYSISAGFLILSILMCAHVFSQNLVPFTPRFNQDVKGDIQLIGNNILGPNNNAFNDDSVFNHTVDMRYIDIDGDASTFNSSSADLTIPNPGCYQIIHAGLYWGAVTDGVDPITNVKFKGPTGGYNDVVGTVIFDATSLVANDNFPYACFADVTSIVTGLANDLGTYTVGNVSTAQGQSELSIPRNGTGFSAGWSLYIVYEDPTLTGKSITSFDGFSAISTLETTAPVTVSGFRTIPAPAPVRANFAFAALEGDKPIPGDRMLINGVELSTVDRINTNFFNSSVTQLSATPVNNRNPNSTNTLGFDTGIMAIPNPTNTVIANNDTSATVTLQTTGDTYFPYFFALAVEIIEPNIVLTKIVEDTAGNNIANQIVNLGDELNYVIAFQNTGNDDARNLIIKDILPTNIVFNFPSDLGLLPPGVSVRSYDSTTRELIFSVDNSVVQENDPIQEIRFRVRVVSSCSLLNDACSNIISNQAFSTYNGTLNETFLITDDPSFSTNVGCLLTPAATNFLADIDCVFEEEVILCGASTVLTSGAGFDEYSWSRSPTGTPVIGTTQSITVTETGTYYVSNTAIAPCQSTEQTFEVITFGAGVTNPLIPFANQVVICPDDGLQLPNFFLCGANDSRLIETGITDTNSIIWEILNETSCAAVVDQDCANQNASCTWNQVATGPDFLIDNSGQYRLTLNYTGGCFNQFYFNVYENLLIPTATSSDIVCTTPGEITVSGVPNGYEYSTDNINFQSNNIFSITTPGIYTVYIRLMGVTQNPCIFTVPDIQIRARDFTVSTIITQPLCNGELGSLNIAANDARPQYTFSISQGPTLVNSEGPIIGNSYEFENLNPGIYTINVSTEDGCTHTEDIEIINPPLLTATSALTNPLTCTDGEITVTPAGGTSPYFYFVNSTTVFQTTPVIVVTAGGTFNITVVDSNNCTTQTTITVAPINPPEFNITKTDILCSDLNNSGEININVTNANGNTLAYSIDNGVTYTNSPVFTGLTANDYEVIVQYTNSGDICTTLPQTITIAPATAISGTATLTAPYTCISNGVITVAGVSGGVAPYSYSIDGITFQPELTFSGLTNGTYTVTVRDNNTCTFVTAPIVIEPLNPTTDLDFSNTALTCPSNTSNITVGATGGSGVLEYQIIDPSGLATPFQNSNVFNNLVPGVYTFQVRDENDCLYSESYNISPLPTLNIVGQTINDVVCFGTDTGRARFTISGTSNFTYTINGGALTTGVSPIELTGLATGNYTIEITDIDTNCQETATVTIDTPTAALAVTAQETVLTCITGGSVTANATGGWGSNTYALTLPDATVLPLQSSNTFSNLNQVGTYTVTVTDARGCIVSDNFVLSTPPNPTANIDVSSNLCFNASTAASLIVNASGGELPYQYNINGGPFVSTNTFDNLGPGTYTISVRDAFGCFVVLPAEIIAQELTLNTVLDKGLDCTVSPDAVITGTIANGYPDVGSNYQYAVSINGSVFSNLGTTGTTFTYNTSTPGTYQFQVTDTENCQVLSNVININTISNPAATTTNLDATCTGFADGSVQISPTGGVGPYTYSFDGGAFTTTSTYTGLLAGTYAYEIRDANACPFVSSVTISEPSLLTISANASAFSCSNTNVPEPAIVTIDLPTTGTAPYRYSFNGSGFSTTNTLTVNDNGTNQTINYAVRDAQGCEATGAITLSQLNPPTDLDFSATDITCSITTSTLTLTATNGVGTLEYETIAPSPIIFSPQASNVFSGLTVGTYVIRVTDSNGCFYTESFTINPVVNITTSGQLLSNVSCVGGNDGSVEFMVSNFGSTYSYTINGGTPITNQTAPTITLAGLSIGDQTIITTDETTNCTATTTVTVSQPLNALNITSVNSTNVNCNAFNSQITITAAGGTPSYTYAAVVSGAAPPVTYNSSNVVTVDTSLGTNLSWDVYVRDANGCINNTTTTIIIDALPTVTLPAIPSNQCTATSGFTFMATGTGIAPLTYSINGGVSFQSSPTFTVSSQGTYTVTVRDANGCTATSTTPLEIFAPIITNAALVKDLTCSTPVEASIEIMASGGNGAYSYEVSSDGGSTYTSISGSPFTTALAGTYQFRITDVNACTQVTNPVTVTTPVNPSITSVTQTEIIRCNGEETAAIAIIIDNTLGLAPFDINVTNTTTSRNYGTQTSGLAAGDYEITLTDDNGCFDTASITILQPSIINVTYSSLPITCQAAGPTQGSVIVEGVTGGTGPYNYFVTSSNGYSNSELNNLGTTSTTFDVVDFGLYQILVEDSNGCTFLIQDVLVASPPNELDITVAGPVDCSIGGSATVTISTPLVSSGPFHFAIYTTPGMLYTTPTTAPWQDETTPGSGSTIFTGLIPGAIYTFVVFDQSTNCYYFETSSSAIPTNSTLTTSAVAANNITCTGNADGNISFDVTSTYVVPTNVDFEIFDSLSLVSTGITGSDTVPANSTLNVSNLGPLAPGNYIVVVTEASGATNGLCSVTTSAVSISESATPLAFTASISRNENCNELGVITGVATNGTAPYDYQIRSATDPEIIAPTSTGWASPNTFERAAGDYTVYVKDAFDCIVSFRVTLIRDAEPTINTVPQVCFDGTPVSITLVEGTGIAIAPLTYSIGGAYQSSNVFSIGIPGTYNLSIRDGNGCIASTTYVLAPQLLLDANLTQDLTCTDDASIDLIPNGGTGMYSTFEVSFNGGGYTIISGTPYTTVIDGTYQFRVIDSQGCVAESAVITVTPNTNPTLNETHIDITCNGDNNGSINITASNGIAPYQYSIDNGVTFQPSGVFNNLRAAGNPYNLVVIDSKNCQSIATPVTIIEPALVTAMGDLTTALTCGIANAPQEALVTITASGGTVPYMYSYDGGLNFTLDNTFRTFTPQTVSALVRDANGCTISTPVDVVIPSLSAPTDLDFTATPITCLASTSDITLTTTNGVGALTYSIVSPVSAITNVSGATSGVFTGLAPDTYVFTVTDANSCDYTEAFSIIPVTNITVQSALISDVICNGDGNGAVAFTVGNFQTTYRYTINGGVPITGQTSTSISLSGLSQGNQDIIVTDETTNCTANATITVNEPTPLTLVETINNNANCNSGAQVNVTASGGTPIYRYAFVEDGILPLATDYRTSSSAILNPSTNTNWDVWVIDTNGCTAQIDIIITADPLPAITLPTQATNQCNLTGDLYTFTVATTTGVGPFTYSIGDGFQTSDTFTNLVPGNYTVTVRDVNNCEATSSTSIDIFPALNLSTSLDALPSCIDGDGQITLTGFGGSGNYSYTINPSPDSILISGNVISGIPSGAYTVTITDTTTLCTNNASVTFTTATPVLFTTSVNDVSCNGGSDGSITVNLPASNNNPIYTYEIIAGPTTVTPQTSNIFTGLAIGSYTVRVNSGRGCSETEIVSINEPVLLETSGVATEFSCTIDNAVNTSTLIISETGGTAPYAYSIDGVNYLNNNIFNIIDTGTVQNLNIFVRDANACIATNAITLNPLEVISTTVAIEATPIDCNGTGSIAVNITGGSGNFDYQMLPSGVAKASNIFNITTPGDYFFRVNDLDTGCYSETLPFTVAPFNTAEVVLTPTSAITCFGDTNGAFEIDVTNYSGAYTYQVFNSAGVSVNGIVTANTTTNPEVVSGIEGGNFTVTLTQTESPFCTVISNLITIDSPISALSLLATETSNVSCDDNIGTITAIASGGWGTYEYELTGAATVAYSSNGTFTNLSAGNYTVNVRDINGCIVSDDVMLVLPSPITATVTANTNTLSCFGDANATITATTVNGGQNTNYTYTLNSLSPTVASSGPQTLPEFNNIGPGTYSVTIRDGLNCEFTSPDIIITQPTEVQANLVLTTSQTCTTDATLTLSATGGTGSYEYSESQAFTSVSLPFTTSVTFPVTNGTYMYYVRDTNGCISTVSNDIVINEIPMLTVNLESTAIAINCAGDNSGVITARAEGGLGNYVYTLQDLNENDITPVTQNSPGAFTNLPAGTYQVRVDSGDCLATSAQITITEPLTALTAIPSITDITCFGSNDGNIEITAAGGTGIIKYSISPRLDQFFETPIFNDLAPGNYQVIAQDEAGCFEIIDFTINDAPPIVLTIIPNSILPEVCSGDMNGEFSISITGGNMPYSVAIDNINGVYTTGTLTQTEFEFLNLNGGDHLVFVRDALGCETEWNITFPNAVLLEPEAIVAYDCINNLSTNTVTVTVDESVDTNELDYSLNGGAYQTSNIFINVPPGINHIINVRHTNGCIKQTSAFSIIDYQPLQLVLSDGEINQIVATANGGSGIYEYDVRLESSSSSEPFGNTNTFVISESGNYTVTVTDSFGCIASATRFYEFIDVCISNYFTPNGDGVLDEWGPGCTINFEDLTFDIFDRYGRKVASLLAGQKWDGTYNGANLPSGDYWYVVKLNDEKDDREFVGNFTLYR